ncbi:MAG: hypothetical protein HY763_07415 [Planctomycetes bacterium]|nr:hypothetical protein [Planctomycetota bacterium]
MTAPVSTSTKSMAERASSITRDDQARDAGASLQRKHLRFGWWSLLCFLAMGLGLEALHGFKVGFYLDLAHETRRLLWTLAHAHGTLLALVHIGFAATLRTTGEAAVSPRASGCLLGASILLPGGFFLGGLFPYDGDPGIGVLLVPVGALLLFAGVLLTAMALSRAQPSAAKAPRKTSPTKAVKQPQAQP